MAYSTGMIQPRVQGINGQGLGISKDSDGISQLDFMHVPTFVYNTVSIVTTEGNLASVPCTSLGFAVVSNAHYLIDGVLLVRTSIATDGFMMALSFSGASLAYAGIAGITQLANAGTTNMFYGGLTTANALLYAVSLSGLPDKTVSYPVIVKGMIVTHHHKGTIVPRIKTETGGSKAKISIMPCSCLVIKRIS